MTLIEDVARLKKQLPPEPGMIDLRFTKEMLYAAPAMLDILGGFRAGDNDIFACLTEEKISDICECKFCAAELDMLRRYQAMTEKMEGKC
jgi:hypothetical protein